MQIYWFLFTGNITKFKFYQLENIARVHSFLSVVNTDKLLQAFIPSQLDYCYTLLSGLPKKTTDKLQRIPNEPQEELIIYHC